jgi:serine phosphatase RsbU (regulator of sigma subunit)
MVTAFVGVIAAGQRTMRYASAGHAPALLPAVDGTVTQLGAAGPPLGCGDVAAAETHETLLAPGSCLLLYTDGLIEWSRDISVCARRHRRPHGPPLRPVLTV